MSVLNDCWNKIVGITRNTECLEQYNRPDDYNTSLSGLYLDELRGINLMFVQDTGQDLWDKINIAYQNAIRTFKSDIVGEILKYNKLRYSSFIGNIGSQRYKNNLALTKQYAGVRMYCNDIKGGIFNLKAIGVILNTSSTFNLEIYDNLSETPLHTIELTSVANKFNVTNITPIELQLSDSNYDNLEYFFLYQRGSMQPKDNKPTCGCGGVNWCFNVEHPCFADAKATKERWRQFAMIGGIEGDTIADREDWGIAGNMNGIVLIGEFKCDLYTLFCNDNMDFENEPIGQAVAHAINYKWGEFVMDYFLDTQNISRYTTLGLEAINNNREYYNARYAVMVNFITENLDISQYGCLSCKSLQNAKFSRQLL